MKILIETVETGHFFQAPGQWVPDRESAKGFRSSLEALDYCLKHDLKRTRIVLSFDNPRYDIWLDPFSSAAWLREQRR